MFTMLDYHNFIVSKIAPPAPPSVVFIILSSLSQTHAIYHFKQSYLHKEVTMCEHVLYLQKWAHAPPLLSQDLKCRKLHFYG